MGYAIAFDVETADKHHTRICSIGFCKIENGQIVDSQSQLIDPECAIEPYNQSIHGISDEDVAGQPKLKQFWDEHAELFFNSDYLVAHHAPFDLSALGKHLTAYGIEKLEVNFVDTLNVVSCCFPELSSPALDLVAQHLNIEFVHHQAGDDSRACAQIFCKAIERGFSVDDLKSTFIFPKSLRRQKRGNQEKLSQETIDLQSLLKIIQIMLTYGYIDDDDLDDLERWITEHPELKTQFPCNLIAQSLEKMVSQPFLKAEDYLEMQNVLQICVDPVASKPQNQHLIFKDKLFCVTGSFEMGPVKEVERRITECGGQFKTGITKNADYLIVGDKGSARWSLGNYGEKIKKVIEWQMKDSEIRIVKESDFRKALQAASGE